jgi:hypothetical protein
LTYVGLNIHQGIFCRLASKKIFCRLARLPNLVGITENRKDCEFRPFLFSKALYVLPEDWREKGGEERSGVDGEVKDGEERLQLSLLLRQFELVAAKGSHARLDAARAHRDEEEADQGKFAEKHV